MYLSPGFLDVQSSCSGPGTVLTSKETEPGETAEELDKCVTAARALQEKCCGYQPICESPVQRSCHTGCPFHLRTPSCCCSAGDLPSWGNYSIAKGRCCCFMFTTGSGPVVQEGCLGHGKCPVRLLEGGIHPLHLWHKKSKMLSCLRLGKPKTRSWSSLWPERDRAEQTCGQLKCLNLSLIILA